MAVMFFGQYLVEKGIVARDVLLKAIALQEQTNLSFGDTAVAMGLLSTADADRINQAQRSQDMRIGDLSVKMGLLSEQQVMAILAEQKRRHIYIGEAVVAVGGLTPAELELRLQEFKANQAQYATDNVSIPAGVPHRDVWEMTADLTYKMLTRVARVTYHTETCYVAMELPLCSVTASMQVSGDCNARYLFGCSEGLQAKIAQAILSADDVSSEPQEVLDDTVMEFINVVCGNVVAKAAQLGKQLEIHPPEIIPAGTEVKLAAGETCLVFPIFLADGDRGNLILVVSA